MKKQKRKVFSLALLLLFSLSGCNSGSSSTYTPVESIEVSSESISLGVGETMLLKVSVLPTDASEKSISYLSSNPLIAAVDKDGRVLGVKEGECSIYLASGSKQKEIKVTVRDKKVSGVVKRDGSLKADIQLALLGMGFDSISIHAPLSLTYPTKQGEMASGKDRKVAIEIPLNQGIASENKSESEQGRDNLIGFKKLVDIPDDFSLFRSFLPGNLFASLPSGWKLLGSSFKDVAASVDGLTGDALENALEEKEESLLFYSDSEESGLSEYNVTDGKTRARGSVSFGNGNGLSTSFSQLLTDGTKEDFFSLVHSALSFLDDDEDLIPKENQEKYASYIYLLGEALEQGFRLSKSSEVKEDKTYQHLTYSLDPETLLSISNLIQNTLVTEYPILSTYVSLLNLSFTSFALQFTTFEDETGSYFSEFAFDTEFSLAGSEQYIHVDFSLPEDPVVDSAATLNAAKEKNSRFQKVSKEAYSFLSPIEKDVALYDGDTYNGFLDISLSEKEALDNAVASYDSLSEDAKFLLTSYVDKEKIPALYQKGREVLRKTIEDYKTKKSSLKEGESFSLEDAKKILASSSTSLVSYKNWEKALEEDSEGKTFYNEVSSLEKKDIDSLTSKAKNLLAKAKKIEGDSSTIYEEYLSCLEEIRNLLSSSSSLSFASYLPSESAFGSKEGKYAGILLSPYKEELDRFADLTSTEEVSIASLQKEMISLMEKAILSVLNGSGSEKEKFSSLAPLLTEENYLTVLESLLSGYTANGFSQGALVSSFQKEASTTLLSAYDSVRSTLMKSTKEEALKAYSALEEGADNASLTAEEKSSLVDTWIGKAGYKKTSADKVVEDAKKANSTDTFYGRTSLLSALDYHIFGSYKMDRWNNDISTINDIDEIAAGICEDLLKA